MRCPDCEHENPPNSRFCNHCGASQQRSPEAPPGRDASTTDGKARGERRQLSVVFCDLVDSTRLAERIDPEDLREVLGKYHAVCTEAIERYEGYVAQYLGDGILAYFGYPQAHEDDAERAVRCALEVQRRLGEHTAKGAVRARIGIHTGLVIVDEIGSEAKRETLALGGTTNLAARIHEVALEGGVSISEATHRLTAGVFGTRDLGRCQLKGLDEPVRLYAVDRVLGGRRRRVEASTPLLGRKQELDLLTERFDRTAGGEGQAVLISGEPGIGKSRLAVALRDEIAATPHTWVDMACSPYTAGSAFRPVIDLFEERLQRLRFLDDTTPERLSQLLSEWMANMAAVSVDKVVPYLLALLGLPPLDALPLPAIAPAQQRERTMRALCAIVEGLAAHQPVVIEIEDLQWADPSTREFLGRLVDLAPGMRLLLLCTARPEFELPWSRAHVAHLELGRLPATPTLEMIDALSKGRHLPSELSRQIAQRSDGVPYFIEELTRAIFESDLISDRGDRFEPGRGLADTTDLAIPTTLQGSLMARLDRLGPAKRIAQLGATLGREFSYELIEKVGELHPASLRDGLVQLVEAEILSRRGELPHETYRFKHALLQDTAYQSQLRSDRSATHARVAAALESHFSARVVSEPAVMAHHCAEAGLYDQAATHYQAAGTLAVSRYANDEAMRYLRLAQAALGHLPEDDARHQRELSVRLAMAPPLIATRSLGDAEVEQLHQQIASLCSQLGEGAAQLPGLLYLSRYHHRRGAIKKGVRLGESILHIAQEADIPLMEVVARLIIGSCKITTAPLASAIADLERALEVAKSIDLPPATSPLEPELLAFIHATLGVALAIGGRPDEAAAQARAARARALAEQHEPTRIHVMALSTITLNLFEDFEETLEWGREALALAEGRGFRTAEAQARTNVGWARVALGDLAGLEDVEAGLAHAEEVGFLGGLCEYVEAAAEANRLAGRYERALELLDRGREIYQTTGEVIFEGRGRRVRGMIHVVRGEREMAEAELSRALEILSPLGAQVECLTVATELLRLVRGRDDEPAARQRLADLYAGLRGGREYRPLREAKALLDETARDS